MPRHDSILAGTGITTAILAAVIGLATSAVLLQHHVAVEAGSDPLLGGVCTMGERTSCDEVLSSEWGKLLNVPTALWGLMYFAAIGAWYVIVGRPTPSRRALQLLPVIGSALGAGIAAGLAFIMYSRLPTWCPLCAVTHVMAGLLFLLSLVLWPRKAPQPPVDGESPVSNPEPAHPGFRHIALVAVLALLTSGFAWSEYNRRIEKAHAAHYYERWQYYESDHAEVYRKFMAQPKVDIPIGPDEPVRGNPDAAHTIVLFADFQCLYCRDVDRLIQEKIEKYPARFKYVFKHFPMNRDCNRHVTGKTHAGSCAASVTAEAARKIGGNEMFWRMHDELFTHQAQFARRNREFMVEATQRLGLDLEALWNNIRTSSVWQRISQNVEEAHAIGVNSTPVVYLDGRRLEAWSRSKFWEFIVYLDVQQERDRQAGSGARSRPATAPDR